MGLGELSEFRRGPAHELLPRETARVSGVSLIALVILARCQPFGNHREKESVRS